MQQTGACNALWTFHYEEGYPDHELYTNHTTDGLHVSGNALDGYYTVRNHEVDIEFPSALKTYANQEEVYFTNSKFNCWLGELRNWDVPNNDVPTNDPMYSATNDPAYWSEYTDDWINHGINLADGNYHKLRIDWHCGPSKTINYYFDDVLVHTISKTDHVPDIAGRFWIGVWFPSGAVKWAGALADFIEQNMYVTKVSITPYVDEDQYVRDVVESYPNDVFRDISNFIY